MNEINQHYSFSNFGYRTQCNLRNFLDFKHWGWKSPEYGCLLYNKKIDFVM